MRSPTLISLAAFLLGIAALSFAASRPAPLSEEEIEALVDGRIAARERRFVQAHAPKFREMFGASGALDEVGEWSPATLEELVAPLMRMLEK